MPTAISAPTAGAPPAPRGARSALPEFAELIRPLFVRREPRETALRYVAGLIAAADTANCWRLAQASGDRSPWRMQRLLGRARWDAAAVREVVRGFAARTLGHPGAVLILREVVREKKGT
jgi:SRSO17 transposase